MTRPPPLIEISGPPSVRGQSYGRQAAERIHLGIRHYTAQLAALGLASGELAGLIRAYLPLIVRFEPAYVEEMRGIAAGAAVPFEDVVLLNARTEIVKLARRPDLRAQLEASMPSDGCTVVVAAPPATRDRPLIHAQNWDWKQECADTVCVLRVRQAAGPDLLTFTEAGVLARAGLNSAGIAITGNYLESDRDYRRMGIPLALIRRKALEQSHLAQALQTVYVTAKSCSNNMVVSHASGLVINFECAPDETFPVDPIEGLLVHSNHFASPVALAKLKDTGMLTMPDSLYRDRRVRSLLAPRRGDLTRQDIESVLFDDFETPYSVCRPPRSSSESNLTATVAMIVMIPEQRLMRVAMLPALSRTFTEFRLDAGG